MKRRKPVPLEQQIACIAGALDRSVITIKTWCREGMDPYDPDSITQFWHWKVSRLRNRPNHEKAARQIRGPND